MKKLPSGYYKVAQVGGCYISATFYNPDTKDTISCCVRDYDYLDGSRDNDELYYMEINEVVRTQWLHNRGVILVNDVVEVVKGRKVPIGTIAKVIDKKPYKDRYGRTQATYLYFDNGMKTNEDNCRLTEQ